MKLTLTERVLLVNQYKILSALQPESEEMYNNHIEALVSGYTLHYDWLAEGFADEVSESDCRKVMDILEMIRMMHIAYRDKHKEIEGKYETLRFPGFDGNQESRFLGYSRYFMHDLGRFEELQVPGDYPEYNTHMPVMGTYESMLSYWQSLESQKYELTSENLKKLLELSNGIFGFRK